MGNNFHILLSLVHAVALSVFLTVLVTPVRAQTARQDEDLGRFQEQLQRQEQERLRSGELERLYRELEPPSRQRERKPLPLHDEKHCLDITAIEFEGVTVLGRETLYGLAGPFRHRCLGADNIQTLLEAVNGAYYSLGYVTSRAFLRGQQSEAGRLFVTVVEGRVEELAGHTGETVRAGELFSAFPVADGDLLNLRDIEQGLDQMNRLASNDVTMEISPGAAPGASRVIVGNDQENRLRLELGRNNSGNRSTGLLKNRVSVEADSLLGLNEGISLSYQRSAHGYSDARRSHSLTGYVSVPFGYWTASYTGSYSTYGSLVEASVQDFLTSGMSRSHKAALSYVLHRDATSKTRLDAGLTARTTRNYIEDILIDASSRRLSIGSLTLSRSQRLWSGVLLGSVGYEKGLVWFDALKDEDGQDSDSPKAQFRKWTFDARFRRAVPLAGQTFHWSQQVHGVYSPDTLYGTERIGLGGPSSVRGFRDETLSGDRGIFVRNEIAWLPKMPQGWPARIGSLSPYVAYDRGWIPRDKAEARERGVLSGATIGLRNMSRHTTLALAYSRALSAPAFLEERGHALNFTARVTF